MTITLKNQFITLNVDTLGGEMQSILFQGREYLWQGNPDIWKQKAPILFPIIGRLRHSKFTMSNTQYEIGAHGFARNTQFEILEQRDDFVSLSITDSPATLKQYPFTFRFTVSYELINQTIHKTHRVENTSDVPLYYEVGGHDGFCIPFSSEEKMGDCRIRLPEMKCFSPYEFDDHISLLPKSRTIDLDDGKFVPTVTAYGVDSVILDDMPVRCAELLDGQGRVRVSLTFEDFPYLTLWTKDYPTDTNYICIEPWSSLPDEACSSRELKDKTGIRKLNPRDSESLSYQIHLHDGTGLPE